MLFTMWLAGNRHNASRCNRDKARRQDCSGRTLVLLPHKHRLVFSLSRNGIRDGKSAMVCQSASRISGPNQSQKADVGSWVNCQIIAARSCNVHPVKVRLAIHHVSHVAAFTEELHELFSNSAIAPTITTIARPNGPPVSMFSRKHHARRFTCA